MIRSDFRFFCTSDERHEYFKFSRTKKNGGEIELQKGTPEVQIKQPKSLREVLLVNCFSAANICKDGKGPSVSGAHGVHRMTRAEFLVAFFGWSDFRS
jgi:hypothetical protein